MFFGGERRKKILSKMLIGLVGYVVISEIISVRSNNKYLTEENANLRKDYQDQLNKNTAMDITIFDEKWRLRSMVKKHKLISAMMVNDATEDEIEEFKDIVGMDPNECEA